MKDNNNTMAQQKNVLSSLLSAINDLRFDDLDRFLKNDVEWESVGDILIIPQQVRKFIKSIQDKEARMDVARFLHKYARQYFREAAEGMENKEREEGFLAVGPDIPIKTAEERIALFQQELAFLLDQDESTGEFSGNKFKMQQERIKQLEKQVEELVDKNAKLETQLDRWEHPYNYGKYIPDPFRNDTFVYIMNYLKMKGIVREMYSTNEMGFKQICCYHWDGSKALFGYFVDKINDILNLRGARVPLDWKVFEPAIHNYNDIVGEARKALSTYKNSSSLQQERIKDVDKIDEAVKNALEYVNRNR